MRLAVGRLAKDGPHQHARRALCRAPDQLGANKAAPGIDEEGGQHSGAFWKVGRFEMFLNVLSRAQFRAIEPLAVDLFGRKEMRAGKAAAGTNFRF